MMIYTNISILKDFVGKSGWLVLKNLTVSAFEDEDYLLFAGYSDDGVILDSEQCEKMFMLDAVNETSTNKTVNNEYLKQKKLKLIVLGRGMAWLDTGTIENLNKASQFVGAVQSQQGRQIACLEEIAYNNKWIDASKIEETASKLNKTKE